MRPLPCEKEAKAIIQSPKTTKTYAHSELLDMIGISALTGPCLLDALDISRAVKTYNPHIHVVWGGVHPTLLPLETLHEWSVDFVVHGEGEYTLLDLVNALEHDAFINKVNGISYKKHGEIHHTSPRPVIKNLDELPFPACIF